MSPLVVFFIPLVYLGRPKWSEEESDPFIQVTGFVICESNIHTAGCVLINLIIALCKICCLNRQSQSKTLLNPFYILSALGCVEQKARKIALYLWKSVNIQPEVVIKVMKYIAIKYKPTYIRYCRGIIQWHLKFVYIYRCLPKIFCGGKGLNEKDITLSTTTLFTERNLTWSILKQNSWNGI